MNPDVPKLPADADADEAAFVAEAGGLFAPARAHAASCPPPSLVSAAAAGVLPTELQLRVTAHVESCPLCRALEQEVGEVADVSTRERERVWASVKSGIAADARQRAREHRPGWRAWWTWRPVLATLAIAVLVVGAAGVSMLRTEVPWPPARPDKAGVVIPSVSVLVLDRPVMTWSESPTVLWRGTQGPARQDAGLDAALAAYDAGRFDESTARLTVIVRRAPGLGDARLALGVSLLHLGRPREALDALGALTSRDDVRLADEASWYSALAWLRLGGRGPALESLRRLCDGSGARAIQACAGVNELLRSGGPPDGRP